MNDKELSKKISQINKSRAEYYEFYTGLKWGDKENYDICLNTSGISAEGFEKIAEVLVSLFKIHKN